MGSGTERRLNFSVLALTFAVLAAAIWVVPRLLDSQSRVDCDDFHIGNRTWASSDSRDELAQGIVQCESLVGLDRTEISDLLGSQHGQRRRDDREWTYYAGEVNDGMGPGDGQTLTVAFDESWTVVSSRLTYSPD